MEKHYDLIQTAELVGLKVRTLRQWIRDGRLNAKKIPGGQKWVVSESEIKRLQNEEE